MRFRFAYWSVVLVSVLGGGPSSLLADDAVPAWQLHPAAQASLAGIYLDELFVTTPALLPHVRLPSSCISAGQSLSFTRAQIAELIHEHAPDVVVTNWIGPAQIRITRRKRQLDEAELKTLLTETLQRDYVKEKGELELRF